MHQARQLTVEQAAEILGLHVRTVRRHIREGRLPAVRLGRSYRIDPAALEEISGVRMEQPTRVHAEVSCIVELDGVDPARSVELQNLLLGIGGAARGTPPLRIETVYDTVRSRLKIVCLGGLEAGVTVLSMLAHKLEEQGREQP